MEKYRYELDDNLFVTNDLKMSDAFWWMCALCRKENAYLNWTLEDLHRLFMIPAEFGNYSLLFKTETGSDDVVALATWAFFDEEAVSRVKDCHHDPIRRDWQSGPSLWIIDFVSTKGFAKPLSRALYENVFVNAPLKSASALKRDSTGKVLRVKHFSRNAVS